MLHNVKVFTHASLRNSLAFILVVVGLLLSECNFDAVLYDSLGLLNLLDIDSLWLVNLLHDILRLHVNVLFHTLLALLQELLHNGELKYL